MNNLVIRVSSADGYTVQFAAGPERATILRAFGTDTLPLPYTAHAVMGDVVDALRDQYPDARIESEQDYLARISEEIR